MHHVVNSRAIHCIFMCSTEILRITRPLHCWTYIFITDIFESCYKQIQLENKLPNLLILPYININLWRTLNNFINRRWIISYMISNLLINYCIYYCTARGPVIFLISSTSQPQRSAALVPILFLLIQINIYTD